MRGREVDVYVPVVLGVGGVGPVFAGIAAAVAVALLVLFVVCAAYPAPRHTPIPAGRCEPFCSQYNTDTSVSAVAPVGGEQR